MKEKDKTFETMESDYKVKIGMLDKILKSEQEDDDYLTPLAGAIFNCTTMEEIFEIKNLIESYKVNELTEKHYKTLQNMFLSLSYGVYRFANLSGIPLQIPSESLQGRFKIPHLMQ